MTASVDSYAEIKSAPSISGVTKSGRVWRKVPESDVMLGLCLDHCRQNRDSPFLHGMWT